MITIGIDPHKGTHTAAAVKDATGQFLDELTVPATDEGAERLHAWAHQLADGEELCFALEDVRNVSGRLERFLLARQELVLRVGTRLMVGTRKSARTFGKSDSIDALAIARAALREPGLPQATHEPALRAEAAGRPSRGSGLRAHRDRLAAALASARTGSWPGAVGADPEPRADPAWPRPAGGARFATDAQLARHAGCAPIEVSSGRVRRHRLLRMGNRKLNAALHQVVLTQARVHPPARAYLDKKRAEGKSTKEAFRCLKRHLVRVVWRALPETSENGDAISSPRATALYHETADYGERRRLSPSQ